MEHRADAVGGDDRAVDALFAGVERDPVGLARNLHREVDAAPLGPAERPAAADQDAVGLDLDPAVVDQRPLAGAAVAVVAEVDQQVAGAGGEAVPLPPDACFRAEFGPDAVAQGAGIIAGLGGFLLVGLAIAFAGAVGCTGEELDRSARGDDQHVHHVGDAGARQMRVREAHDRRVAVMVARAVRPVLGIGVGADLHHAERHGRAGIGMAVAAGADPQVGRRGTRAGERRGREGA